NIRVIPHGIHSDDGDPTSANIKQAPWQYLVHDESNSQPDAHTQRMETPDNPFVAPFNTEIIEVFHMAQQVIPAAQLVPRFHTIRRCNNYTVLQSIPCSPECKIVGQIILDHPLSYALTVTANVLVVYLQLFWRTVSKLHAPEHTIRVGYQGVIDKVSAFYTKNLAQPWQTMFKDDIPLVSVYTTGNVLIRGMLIPDAFLTEEIRATDGFKDPQGKKRKQNVKESSSPNKSLKITIRQQKVVEGNKDDDDSQDRLEPKSLKDKPEYVDNDDDKGAEKEWDAWVEETVIDEDKFKNVEEYAYHLKQTTNFSKNQIVWESRQEEIRHPVPRPLVFFGPQRNPNKPLKYLYNKDLFFLKHGNTKEKKYILSLHKIQAERFPEADLEEKMNHWVHKEFKTFNEEA
nr:hypothetical protein [Tanacetum cinerariifolium]